MERWSINNKWAIQIEKPKSLLSNRTSIQINITHLNLLTTKTSRVVVHRQVERQVNKYQHRRINNKRKWHNFKYKMQLMLVCSLKAVIEL